MTSTVFLVASLLLVGVGASLGGWALAAARGRRVLEARLAEKDARLALAGEELRMARNLLADRSASAEALRARLAERRSQLDRVVSEMLSLSRELDRTRVELAEHARRAAAADARAVAEAQEAERARRRVAALEARVAEAGALREENLRLSEHVRTLEEGRPRPVDRDHLAELEEAHYEAVALKDAEIARLRAVLRHAGPGPQQQAPRPADDLTRIPGIDRRLSRELLRLGVTTWRQIARWTPQDVALTAVRLALDPAVIEAEGWVASARALVESYSGGGRGAADRWTAHRSPTLDEVEELLRRATEPSMPASVLG